MNTENNKLIAELEIDYIEKTNFTKNLNLDI
jgi:hypothetical protein